ncbi:MAG: tetratricopeptide repeat protein [Desulfobacteraceae bacterium]|nr:MAG: tetratricopeptide repeat protein [Desulfobacteraceae bacterium]
MVTGVAYDLFKVEAKIRLVNKAGAELGTWQDSASKRKIAIPTSPVGIAATIAEAFLDDSAKKKMRLVVYDWGWKVSQFVPDSPLGKSLPEVFSVESNIDKDVFAAGEQIIVQVASEKDLTCSFDLGNFKKSLPMSNLGGGAYKGVYVVQEGDQVSRQPLSIHLFRSNGVERVWHETAGTVTIDGVLPPAPEKVTAQASRAGVSLTWALPQSEDLKAFAVEKSEKAVGDFAFVANTKDLYYLDAEVSQGHSYYYRIRAVDPAGNRSSHEKTILATMPFYDEVKLSGSLSGTLVSGVYRLEGQGTIARGSVLNIGADVQMILAPGARMVVNGILTVKGSLQRPTIFAGQGWKKILVAERGQVELTHVTLKGCAPCVEADGGSVVMDTVFINGDLGDGIVLKEDGVLALKGGQISGCMRGVAVEGGRGTIEKCLLTANEIGLDKAGGDMQLNKNNVFDNRQSNLRARNKVVLEGNYLGATIVKELKMEGDVLVKSLLDTPFPHGRTVVLIDDSEVTPETLEKRFEAHKCKGIDAFTQRRFGDAYQELSQAAKIKEDKEVYLYLAYTQSSLGEEEKMLKTLEQGLAAFPYEVRIYQVYVKYLAAHGKKEKALSLLEKAVKMNPQDQNLLFMKQYVETMGD